MKKAAILTLFGEYNFGNRLQNYAVQEVLKEKGLDVETIKYLLKSAENPNINNKREKERLEKFKEFNKKMKFADETLYMDGEVPEGLGEKYDYLVLGSDQIWNYSYHTFSHKAFGSFMPKQKKFSFSASLGMDWLPEENTDLYKECSKYLKELKAISVREFSGKENIEKLTSRNDIEVLVDPTMMISAERWENLMRKPDNLKTDKFIVKSFLGNVSEEVWEKVKEIAKENECEIIDISDKESPFYDVGPLEFLYLEKNAYMVITDSFHACVFAILFSTPFVVFERQDKVKSMYSRIDTLLKKFELEDNVFNGKVSTKIFNTDYSKIQLVLEEERKKVNDFLEKALN